MKHGKDLKYVKAYFQDNKVTESWKDKFSLQQTKKNGRNLKRSKRKGK